MQSKCSWQVALLFLVFPIDHNIHREARKSVHLPDADGSIIQRTLVRRQLAFQLHELCVPAAKGRLQCCLQCKALPPLHSKGTPGQPVAACWFAAGKIGTGDIRGKHIQPQQACIYTVSHLCQNRPAARLHAWVCSAYWTNIRRVLRGKVTKKTVSQCVLGVHMELKVQGEASPLCACFNMLGIRMISREAEAARYIVALALHLHGQHLQEGHPTALHAVQKRLEVRKGRPRAPQPLHGTSASQIGNPLMFAEGMLGPTAPSQRRNAAQ